MISRLIALNSGVPATRSVIESAFKDLLIGQDPFDNEKLWDDQVLHEPLALRTARACDACGLRALPLV